MENDNLELVVLSSVDESHRSNATDQAERTENAQNLLVSSEHYCRYGNETKTGRDANAISDMQKSEVEKSRNLLRSTVLNKDISQICYEGKCENENTEGALCGGKDSNGKTPLQLFPENCDQDIIYKHVFREINVPADCNCLFWATALAFLIPVKYDNNTFQRRFERLFGSTCPAKQIMKVQHLIQNYDPSLGNASIRKDEMETLVTQKFRNRVIDELSAHKSRFEKYITIDDILYSRNTKYVVGGALQKKFCNDFDAEIALYGIDINKLKPDSLNDATVHRIDTVLDKIPNQSKIKSFKFSAYLECMHDFRAWGGNHEIQAISLLLFCSINVFSDGIQHEIKCDKSNDQIQLYNNGETHYRFGLVKAPVVMEAIKFNKEQEVEAYLNFGVDDTNSQDSDGRTLLHFAAQHGYLKISQLLLAQGARTAVKDCCDQTPEDVALHFQKDHIACLLNGKSQFNQEDEIHNPIQQKQKTYNKRPGTSSISGQRYEIELLMMILLEAIQRKETKEIDGFHLATNMVEAGAFDDVVFKYKYRDQNGEQKSKVIFLQAKHRENIMKDNITIDKLLSESEKDFNLRKYFDCYLKIKQQFYQMHHPIFHGYFEDANCDFVVYTNTSSTFTESQERIATMDLDILNFNGISDSNRYYEMIFDEGYNKKVIDVLQYASDSMRLAKDLAASVLSSEVMNFDKGILKDYYVPIAETVIQRKEESKENGELRSSFLDDEDNEFRDAFLKEVEKTCALAGKSVEDLKLKERCIKLPDSFGKRKTRKDKYSSSLPGDFVSDDGMREFLGNLKFFVKQPNETELSKIIKQKIQSAYRVEKADVDAVFSDVQIKVERWWKDGNEYLTETNTFFQESARVSVWFDVRDPVELFTGREKELAELHEALQRSKDNDKLTVISHLASIAGLGGIGKSELARKYISEYAAKYYDDNVIWINAESYSTLVESFHKLAKVKLGINTENVGGKEKDIKSIVEEAYNYFSKRRSIFIFDNAEIYETREERDAGIDKFLPTLPPKNKPVILITSRNQEWGSKIEKLALDVFTEAEAEKFIRKALNMSDRLKEEEVRQLAEILQYFPLALQQAVAYIREENKKLKDVKENFSIGDYLKQFEKEETEVIGLLDFPVSDDNSYTRTTFITWRITFEKIKQMDYGDKALEIMHIISYFSPDHIVTKVFLKRITDKRELGCVLQLMKQYSLINIEHGEAHIHRLVQQVTRIQLKQKRRERNVLKEALSLLEDFMVEENNDTGSSHTPHAASAWDYASRYKELVEEFSDLPRNITMKLVDDAKYEAACAFGKEASNLLSDTLGVEHTDTLKTGGIVALVLDRQGKYEEAFSEYQHVFDGFKKVLGTDHPYTLTTMNNRAAVLFNLGKYDEALCAYQEVFDKFKKILGCDHPDTLAVMSNVGKTLELQGSYDEALTVFQEVLDKRKRVLESDSTRTLSTMHDIALLFKRQGKYDESMKSYQEVLNKSNLIFGPRHPSTLYIRNNMAVVISEKGDYQEALTVLHEVLDQAKEILGPDHPDTLTTMHEIAIQYHRKGDFKKSLGISLEVLEKRKMTLGSGHPATLGTLHNLGLLLKDLGEHENALKVLEEVLKKREVMCEPDHPSVLDTMHSIGSVLKNQGNYDKAFEVFQHVLDKRKDVLGVDHPDTLNAKFSVADVLCTKARYIEALEAYQEVLKKSQVTLGNDHPCTISVMNAIAVVLDKQGRHDEAVEAFQSTLERKKHKLGPNHPDFLNTKHNLADALFNQGNYDVALKECEEVFEKRKAVLGLDHPDTLSTMNLRASILGRQGYHDKALKASEEVLAKMEVTLGPDNPLTLSAMNNIATILDERGNHDEALKVLEKMIPKFQHVFGADHPFTLSAINNRAVMFSKLGNFNGALENYEMVLEKFEQLLEPDDPRILCTMQNIATVLDDQEKYDAAFKVYEQVLEKRKKILGLNHPDYLTTKDSIAGVLCNQGKYGEAYETYKEILEKRTQIFGRDHADTLITRENIACVLYKGGKYDEALKSYREVLEKSKEVLGIDHPYTLSLTRSVATMLGANE